ncbi:kinesin-like protein KIF19 isoform X1 [Aricia agestis]|uniref:kinesin-like protein KIF19 isoform X1 n=1 Tax=Aricia agestis TaxID=91739 RepID=UPI001C20B008|nr:kinesin-like protein KIF19 isoform X1 [Aricia agestis]
MTQSIYGKSVSEEKLMVAVRVRPLRADEGARVVHVVSDKMLVLEEESDTRRDVLRQRRLIDKHYVYDRVFNEESTQDEVYEVVCAPLVGDTLNGIAGAVFAYGATGAGKTHTMTGLMSRALNHLFSSIAESDSPDLYEVKMSYIEIYNENIRDLLNPSAGPLELRDEGGSGAPTVAGLSEIKATDAAHVAELLARGDRARTAEATHANQHSSRGHALLSVSVSRQVSAGLQRGRLFLIDLAGSERAGLRARRLEGAHINRSLLALGNCIMALSGGARYVNYRDSKLTRLLREVLGGRCRTAMVAHVSPAATHRDTTRSTLHYAQRAATITNKVERELVETPMHLSQYRTVINELREEISRLKSKMRDDWTRPKEEEKKTEENRTEVATDSNENPDNLKALREAIVATFKQQMRLRRRLMELDSHLLGLALDAERQHAAISHWEARFNRLYKPISLTGSRMSTQQSYRGGTGSVASGNSGGGASGAGRERAEAEVAVEQAWAELAAVEREQEAARAQRAAVERQLEQVRLRGAQLEQELPVHINGAEREVLSLVCRVHELEADKLALQGERAARAHELRRRDLALQRRDAQRRLTDEIITRQRRTLEEVGINVQPELAQLYELYQQEIHASTYTENNDFLQYRLPPISSSMSELTWSESSSGSGRGSSSGSGGGGVGGGGGGLDHLPRLAPTPRPRTRYSHASATTLKRYSSDDSLVITAPRSSDRLAS